MACVCRAARGDQALARCSIGETVSQRWDAWGGRGELVGVAGDATPVQRETPPAQLGKLPEFDSCGSSGVPRSRARRIDHEHDYNGGRRNDTYAGKAGNGATALPL